jgi:hypothetical protein
MLYTYIPISVPCIWEGLRDSSCPSNLLWPNIPRPPNSFWRQWTQFLQHITEQSRIINPLSQWIDAPMNSWTWFVDSFEILWHHDILKGDWYEFEPAAPPARPRTRSTSHLYVSASKVAAPTHNLYPATVITLTDGTISANKSPFALVNTAPETLVTRWNPNETPTALQDTPEFFQHLLNTPLTDAQCQDIATELQESTLAICSDSACDSFL